ncbi:MAG: hypothetical protein A2W52_03445 [Candidatus Taylorbacteria bacterium RIFCSPHIGHO2_02_49_25]|uniref:Peptidyl-tRNA hydrolase n=1 Tax=Candidatus Taylorbacteria bacterium RIFCSPHIGHO2_02_49_25 TaxID=1802305 RepID=A0A1G2MIU8_9BACT|nr:MAG: hypothetical protein A2759_01235 [Candidatus Taylorbacteria bacterium RIFCSPHIGHO2_01_FULL_49_60]OHA22922.1 MAG: hypothetical protein A2W52_03445 [Candidatus Taylorbacteria bacterium RIFCSPHIGHO2_02_49_25]OHA35483.1 MAG: hypothetical protein A3B27_01140 [Candidatus Taylorbacteria bacterium RIFCSPLOWO2_01_FULL_50_130]OHA36497.1 MAG: hypothetical protein A2W65_01245 [Candidatus Taylorbacteria bacterium RIFCSPLOWO2_02_50_13]OHA42673.1 MAG: hypothetical protein A3H73_01135 [Candidatus Taylo
MFVLVGLGNPGAEYEHTRHNTGAMVLEVFRKAEELPEWIFDEKLNALVSRGSISSLKVKGQKSIVLLKPQTFMNKSGLSIAKLARNKKFAEQLVIIHDDLDIPFGSYKISFNKSSGGHKGVESIIRAVKTKAFTRVRVGIASSASAIKKSQDDKTVEKQILSRFTDDQLATLKKLAKQISEGLVVLITESREKAMSQYHK